MVRLVLILLILSGLTLFALQNWSVTLPLVFLGIRSQPLPLALWILIAIGLGALSSLAISALVNLASVFATGNVKRRVTPRSPRATQSRNYQDSDRDWDSPPAQSRPSTPRSTPPRSSEDYFDEDLLDQEDDFIDERNPQASRKSANSPPRDVDRRSTRAEDAQRTPAASDYSSYSYRDPANFGAGRREAVYDADYRVIVPPQDSYVQPPFYQEPEINRQPSETVVSQAGSKDDEEDWGFDFEDEDFLDEDADRPSKF